MQVFPYDGQVIVAPISFKEEKTPSGIIIPDTVNRKLEEQGGYMISGKVLDVAKDVKNPKLREPGVLVFFAMKHAFPFKVHGRDFFAVKAEELKVYGFETAEDMEPTDDEGAVEA